MRRSLLIAPVLALASLSAALGQHATTATGFNNLGNTFSEQIGTNWGLNWGGLHVQGPIIPMPQIAPNPSAAGHVGIGGGSNFFNAYFGQSNTASSVSQSSMLTTGDGQSGYMFSGAITPFVVGVVPVVGGYPAATTVQLPTWSAFGVATTVSVPAGGSAFLGGVDGAAAGQGQVGGFGLPGNRAGAQHFGADNARVTAQVHDFKAMDEALLGGALPGNQSRGRSAGMGESSAAQAAPSVAEAKRLYEVEQAKKGDEARQSYQRGLEAEEAGKLAVAKIYYQTAIRHGSSEVRQLAQARLNAILHPAATTTVARRDRP